MRADAQDFFFCVDDFAQLDAPQKKDDKKMAFTVYEFEVAVFNHKWR